MSGFTDMFHMRAQSGDIVDAGRVKRISVMFGMLDEDRKAVGWYQFVSNGKPKSKQELAKPAPKLPGETAERLGYQIAGGVDFTLRVRKHIQLDGVAIHPKGNPATLTLQVGGERFGKIACRIGHLRTKGKEVVTFPFGMRQAGISVPLRMGPRSIHGLVKFVALARYDENKFPEGPQGPTARHLGIPV